MTQADIESERDRLADEYVAPNTRELARHKSAAFHRGFNAAIKLMLEHREKPLREAIDKRAVNPKCQACEQNFYDDSYTLSVQIPEWSFEKEDV